MINSRISQLFWSHLAKLFRQGQGVRVRIIRNGLKHISIQDRQRKQHVRWELRRLDYQILAMVVLWAQGGTCNPVVSTTATLRKQRLVRAPNGNMGTKEL